MTATDLLIAALALLGFVNFWQIISLRHRVTDLEIRLNILSRRVRQLEDAVVWISPNHQLPHIKHLDVQR